MELMGKMGGSPGFPIDHELLCVLCLSCFVCFEFWWRFPLLALALALAQKNVVDVLSRMLLVVWSYWIHGLSLFPAWGRTPIGWPCGFRLFLSYFFFFLQNKNFDIGVWELQSCFYCSLRSSLISSHLLRLTSWTEWAIRVNECKANLRNDDAFSLLTIWGLLFRLKSLSVRLMIGCRLLSMLVSIFCILKSLDFELDLILAQIWGLTLVLTKFPQFLGLL